MTSITADFFRTRQLLPSSSHGSSKAFDEISLILSETKRDLLSAASAALSQSAATLARIEEACAEEGWDGYGASPISAAACERALNFIDALPIWMPAPEIVPEMDGEIAIEWDLGPGKIFSISIGEEGLLHFAGIFGPNQERHGVEPFEDTVPEEILYYINKLFRVPARRRAA